MTAGHVAEDCVKPGAETRPVPEIISATPGPEHSVLNKIIRCRMVAFDIGTRMGFEQRQLLPDVMCKKIWWHLTVSAAGVSGCHTGKEKIFAAVRGPFCGRILRFGCELKIDLKAFHFLKIRQKVETLSPGGQMPSALQ